MRPPLRTSGFVAGSLDSCRKTICPCRTPSVPKHTASALPRIVAPFAVCTCLRRLRLLTGSLPRPLLLRSRPRCCRPRCLDSRQCLPRRVKMECRLTCAVWSHQSYRTMTRLCRSRLVTSLAAAPLNACPRLPHSCSPCWRQTICYLPRLQRPRRHCCCLRAASRPLPKIAM